MIINIKPLSANNNKYLGLKIHSSRRRLSVVINYTLDGLSSNPGVGGIFSLSLAFFCFTLLLARLSNHLKSPVPVRLGDPKGCNTCCC